MKKLQWQCCLILGLALPALSEEPIEPSFRVPVWILDPEVVLQDTTSNEVLLKFRMMIRFPGDLSIQLNMQGGSDTTRVDTFDLRPYEIVTTYLTAHLEDEGQWKFEVSWQYDTDDVEFLSNGPTVVMTWYSLFYVAMACGEIVNASYSPDPAFFHPGAPWPYACSDEELRASMGLELTFTKPEDVLNLYIIVSRSISGRPFSRYRLEEGYIWSTNNTHGRDHVSMTMTRLEQGSGFYRIVVRDDYSRVIGEWHSIPLNQGYRHFLELTLGGGARMLRTEPMVPSPSAKPAAAGLVPASWGEVKEGVPFRSSSFAR